MSALLGRQPIRTGQAISGSWEEYDEGIVAQRFDPEGTERWMAAYKPVPTTACGAKILAGPATTAMREDFTSKEHALGWLFSAQRRDSFDEDRYTFRSAA